ncbi:MFS transporter [Chitinophaga silvisoli]|uniref:MFS transporter n=1 Tax=Chitinophaga silvisoli TaxID=2291814 RepID=A0A3E1NYW4_9BACT|nr:MFS transporter [Chitinophaga silvisoli]RFM33110.1 MFS transporter [Chitinophaga silvisoli]
MESAGIFRSLKYRNFRLYFTGQCISLIGTWMQRLAVSWMVWRITESAFILGLVGFLGLIPSLVLSPYAGAYADRHDRFKILFRSQVASMLQSGALALIILLGWYNMPAILVLSFAQGIINAFDTTSRQSLVVAFIDDKKDLPNAIALNSTMVNLARILGPAVAGVILSAWGEGICFLVDFLTFIAVLISLMLMRLPAAVPQKHTASIWEGFREGYRYLRNHRDIRSVILMLAIINILVTPYSTLAPVFASHVYNGNATTFSWFGTCTGFGALCVAVYMAALKPGRDLLKIIVIAGLTFAVSVCCFSLSRSLPLALFFVALAGGGMMAQIAATNTYVQTHVEDRMRSRVIGYYVMAFQGMLPVGNLITGTIAHQLGAKHTVTIQSIAGAVCVALFAWYTRGGKE